MHSRSQWKQNSCSQKSSLLSQNKNALGHITRQDIVDKKKKKQAINEANRIAHSHLGKMHKPKLQPRPISHMG